MGIFTEEELQADQTGADGTVQQQEDQQQDRARDEQGRLASRADDAGPGADQDDGQQGADEGDAGKGAEQQTQEKGGTVPQGALHAERERRKQSDERWKAAQAQLDAITRMREQIASRQPQQAEPPAIGADEASQIEYLRKRLDQTEQSQQALTQRQNIEQVDNAERQHLAVALTTSEAEFRAQKPDYDAAINHVVNARAQELALYGLNPVEVQQTLQQEVLDITRSALQQGRAPAEVAYQLATLRGYRPEAGQQQQQQQQQPSAAQKQIDAIATARAGSRSLGQASGSAASKDLNANTIAAMSDDEFAVLYSTPEGRRMIDAL